MARVEIKRIEGDTARAIGAKGAAVTKKRVSVRDGKTITLRTLDSASESFGKDFTWVFGANVKKAREENKRITGAADRDPEKG